MEELQTKLREAEDIAKTHGIPFFATMVSNNDEKDTEYETFVVTPLYLSRNITKDYISPMLLVLRGFPVLPKMPEEDATYKSLQKMKKGDYIDIPTEIN